MIRIAGVQLPEKRRIDFALTKIYGIGENNVLEVLKKADIKPATRTKNLTDKQVSKLQKAIGNYKVEGSLKREIQENIQRLKRIKSYRGIRHSKNLPVRGQRTRSNARTKRGKRVTIGAMKKEALAKMEKQKGKKQSKEKEKE